MLTLNNLRAKLQQLANPSKALTLQRFFKTGEGEYGAGDVFLGITVPLQRALIKSYIHLNFKDLKKLLNSKLHEERLCSLLILVKQYQKAVYVKNKASIYQFYLAHTHRINNWDLVDLTAPYIVGDFLFNQDAKPLYQLAQSENLWERRIAIVATHYFIRQKVYQPTTAIAAMLLHDTEDLIHKACGWMLREAGKREVKVLEKFLKQYAAKMPRTMLRYAIEKFPEPKRKQFLHVTSARNPAFPALVGERLRDQE